MPIRLSPAGSRHASTGAALAMAGGSLAAAAALGSIFLSTARDAWAVAAAAGPAAPADAILLVAGLGGTILSLWLGLGMALSALSALPGPLGQLALLLADRVAPSVVRKVIAFVLGTTLTAALIPGTAVAGNSPQTPRPVVVAAAPHTRTAVKNVRGIAVAAPDASFRLIRTPPPTIDQMEAAPPPEWLVEGPELSDEAVIVLRGDTLWSIAAHHLGPAATSPDIDAEWPRWFAANRAVIGDDANLLLPGQLLRPPAAPRARS